MNFNAFKAAVAARFARMSNMPMFHTDTDRDTIWLTYLMAFPPGTDPLFRKRTEHDCSCCRSFIRQIGNIVAIDPADLSVHTIWDIDPIPAPDDGYNTVAKAMAEYVRSCAITVPFLHNERTVGTAKTTSLVPDSDTVQTESFEHFHVSLPQALYLPKHQIGPRISDMTATFEVFQRGLSEFTTDSVDTILDLIAQNSLYRGQEHASTLAKFREHLVNYHRLSAAQQPLYARVHAISTSPAVARIRNTSIGQLLQDLLDPSLDMDQAVRRYEAMVAPANYKRPTALVTPKMIEAAKTKLADLGLLPALSRRYAKLQDITVPNTLFADRSTARPVMADAATSVFDDLAASASTKKPTPKSDNTPEIPIDEFIANVLPTATSIDLFFENRLTPNLVSLIAPEDPTAPNLFKWGNPFSWSYNGDVTDSIKERVKKAGGSVEGDLCCRLAWWNNDDLDFHMREPNYEISYMNRRRLSPNGGMLDVDMNGADGVAKDRLPVENIFYKSLRTMRPGTYELFVHQFSQRETVDVGFEVEIDLMGTTRRFSYPQAVRQKGNIPVATFKVTHLAQDTINIEIIPHLPSSTASKTVWGLPTEQFHPVTILLNSPNHWDTNPDAIGNKHFFFMLQGCTNDSPNGARGFYNEFLKPDLNQHRKVMEMVGSKMRTSNPDGQLSGIGFSETMRNHALVRVTSSFTRNLKVTF